MGKNNTSIQSIPTTIITGFLGVGKTTSILQLLKDKPENESWAVLVNEFGEVGVDGALFQGQYGEQKGVVFREVPGGCMCCAAGLPMQVALNQLLASANPSRLIIEPTGLGHPKEVISALRKQNNKELLNIQQTITLVDARKLHDSRYIFHSTFNQQIDVADIIVGNKLDLYELGDSELLLQYINARRGPLVPVVFVDHGNISLDLLNGKSGFDDQLNAGQHQHQHQHQYQQAIVVNINDAPIPACGYIKVENIGEGYQSIGWRFSSNSVFDYAKLYSWLRGVRAERLKAVFNTSLGAFGYNLVDNVLTEVPLDNLLESRVEIIAECISAYTSDWENTLRAIADLT